MSSQHAPDLTLADIATHLESVGLWVRVDGAADTEIRGIAGLGEAGPTDLSHFSSHRYADLLTTCRAGALLITQAERERFDGPVIITDNAYLAYAHASKLFVTPPTSGAGVNATAHVHPSAQIAPDAHIGPGAVVAEAAIVAAGAHIGANAVIGERCVIGAQSRIMAGAYLYADVRLGRRCVVHSAAVLGADGFGYTPDARGHMVEIAQLGGVVVGDDVSIGANTTIDCGALGDTCIGDGVKIDNQVQIGHNCQIGAHTLICGCVGIVGSTEIGAHCVLAGGAGVGGDGPIRLCDGVIVSGMTHISQSIEAPGVYSGGVLQAPNRRWKRNALRLNRLDELARRVSALEKGRPK